MQVCGAARLSLTIKFRVHRKVQCSPSVKVIPNFEVHAEANKIADRFGITEFRCDVKQAPSGFRPMILGVSTSLHPFEQMRKEVVLRKLTWFHGDPLAA